MLLLNPSLALVLASLLLVWFIWGLVYNLFFHPLRKYPGPLLWRATSAPKIITELAGNYANLSIDIHSKHGDVVRIAPNELSYTNPKAWREILLGSPGKRESEMVKDIRNPKDLPVSMAFAPREDHIRLRRIFGQAFTSTALMAQEPLLVSCADQMVVKMARISAQKGSVDVVDVYALTTVEIMAELVLGGPLGMLEDKPECLSWRAMSRDILKYVAIHGALSDVPVLGRFVKWMIDSAMAKKVFNSCLKTVIKSLDHRLGRDDNDRPDFWHFVLWEKGERGGDGQYTDEKNVSDLDRGEIYINATTFMIAGAESTARTLPGAVYYLCKHPSTYRRLVDEIRATFQRSEDISLKTLSGMEYLNAVLLEVLRIYLPGEGTRRRIVPSKGENICGDYIPGDTRVITAQGAACLQTRNFADPFEFAPERWITDSDARFADDQREINEPFSMGPRSCIGKNLAWFELRLLLAKTLWHYDLELVHESRDWANQRSYVVREQGPLETKLHPVQR